MFQLSPVKKQLIKFTLIGMLAVLVDLACYYTVLTLLAEDFDTFVSHEAFAKTISFLCGMVVTYSLNKLWTWKKKDKSKSRLVKFAGLYGFSLFINVFTNSTLLYLLEEYKDLLNLPYKYFIAFIGATCASAALNFLGQKFWVFKDEGVPHDEEDLFG
jgi:putative flippase GtrA